MIFQVRSIPARLLPRLPLIVKISTIMTPSGRWRWPFVGAGRPPMNGCWHLQTGSRQVLRTASGAGTNIYILIEGDAALTLGGILRQELGVASELLIIDGIVLRDFDYVDIGRIRLPSGMVPVTVKSLLFGASG